MPNHRPLRKPNRRWNRTGAAMILMLLLLIVLMAMVAFSVDIGLMTLLRADIQNAVDSGALAAALKLQENPEDIEGAKQAARDYVRLNRVGMTATVPVDAIEVEHGRFDCEKNKFTATDTSPNSVRVFARQDAQPFFFAKIFGQKTFGAPAEAVASSVPNLDIMLVLDLSGSMGDEGRIQALWNAAPIFVDVIQQWNGDDQIGMMGLSADPEVYPLVAKRFKYEGIAYASGLHPTRDHHIGILEAKLSDDFSQLKSQTLIEDNLPAGKYGRNFGSYTGTGAAIGDAAHYLTYGAEARVGAKKIVVLMSDGYANRPTGNGPGYARNMAAYAADHDVTIYAISLGNDADLNLMQDIADATGGEHFDATGAGESTLTQRLTEAFRNTAAAIKRVQLVK